MGSRKLEEKIEQKIKDELTVPVTQSETIPGVSIDDGEELTEKDVRHVMDEFIRSPSMSGFDSDIRLVMLFMAVQESIEQSKFAESSTCNICANQIDSEKFAIKFIESYSTEKINQKTSIKIYSIKSIANLLQRNWSDAIRNIINGIIVPIYDYFSMEPTDLNSSPQFPYIIKNNHIYHEECYIENLNN